MAQPASSEEVQRIAQMLDGLDRKLTRNLEQLTRKIENLSENLEAALEAIGDEQIESDARQQTALLKILLDTRDEMGKTLRQIKQSLVEAEIDHQKLRRHFESDERKST